MFELLKQFIGPILGAGFGQVANRGANKAQNKALQQQMNLATALFNQQQRQFNELDFPFRRSTLGALQQRQSDRAPGFAMAGQTVNNPFRFINRPQSQAANQPLRNSALAQALQGQQAGPAAPQRLNARALTSAEAPFFKFPNNPQPGAGSGGGGLVQPLSRPAPQANLQPLLLAAILQQAAQARRPQAESLRSRPRPTRPDRPRPVETEQRRFR